GTPGPKTHSSDCFGSWTVAMTTPVKEMTRHRRVRSPVHHVAPSSTRPPQPFPIVGVGASAGGLEAFSELLRQLPADTGMAFVLVQHLDPTHESQLPEVLSRTTTMPVIAIGDRLRVERDHVYVIPANANIAIVGGIFTLT